MILSREEVRGLPADPDKRYLLAEAGRRAADGALLLVGANPAMADFRAWWQVLAPSWHEAACFFGPAQRDLLERMGLLIGGDRLSPDLLARVGQTLYRALRPAHGGPAGRTAVHLAPSVEAYRRARTMNVSSSPTDRFALSGGM